MGCEQHILCQAVQILVSFLIAAIFACDPLIYREGIQVQCVSSGHNYRNSIDCYDRSREIPAGTVARYACDSPLYQSVSGQDGLGSRDGERVLTCNSHGKWIGGLARYYSYHCTLNCGVTNFGLTKPFVHGGNVSKQSDWPWHATIFARDRSTDTEFEYKCGGTLAKPHGAKEFIVITAAHCVARGRYATRNVNDVRIVLGIEQPILTGVRDHSPDAQVFHPGEFVLHGSYEGDRSVYQSDIALIRLVEPVHVTPNIVPICLSKWAGRPRVGSVGHIGGFGYFNETILDISQHLRRASFPVVDPDKCSIWRTRKLNIQEYCAGTDNLQNACNGDSGGGMVFNGTDEYGQGRFYLQGIVSHGRGVWNGKPVACDTFSVFTKLSPYMDWVAEIVDTFGDDHHNTPATGKPPAFSEESDSKPGSIVSAIAQKPCGIINSKFYERFRERMILKNSIDKWPWHASIYLKEPATGEWKYVCGGSLIRPVGDGSEVVVLAAHCFTYFSAMDGHLRNATDVLVGLGLDEMNIPYVAFSEHDHNGMILKVKEIAIHDSYHEFLGDQSFDGNIALLKLATSVSQVLTPVCLSASQTLPALGDVGYMSGFGNSDNPGKLSYHLMLKSLTVDHYSHCDVPTMTPEHQFCAGHLLFTSACNGDYGGGVVFNRTYKDDDDKFVQKFYLEAIVSHGKRGDCHFSVQLGLGPYLDWIYKTTKELLAN